MTAPNLIVEIIVDSPDALIDDSALPGSLLPGAAMPGGTAQPAKIDIVEAP